MRSAYKCGVLVCLCVVLLTNSHAQNVNYNVPEPTFLIPQPTGNTCWATAATMLASWKAQQLLTISAVMSKAGPTYLALFTTDTGLNSSNKTAFLNAMHLKAEPPQNYSARGLESKLRLWGPLWITTNEGAHGSFSIHARLLLGIMGDGTGGGTTLVIADPADGAKHLESLNAFTAKLESVAKSDYGGGADVRPLVVHF